MPAAEHRPGGRAAGRGDHPRPDRPARARARAADRGRRAAARSGADWSWSWDRDEPGPWEEVHDLVERPPASGWVELPSGGELHQTSGRDRDRARRRERARPVVVADLVGDPATATRIALAAGQGTPDHVVAEAVGLLQACGLAVTVVADGPGLVVARTLAMLVNVAADAVDGRRRVAGRRRPRDASRA